MRVFCGSEALEGAARGCAITIGNFDGLHLGHQRLIGEVVSRARRSAVPAALYTFDPHPRTVLEPTRALARLMSPAQLEFGLRELGIDVLIREPFTRELSSLAPEAFVEKILAERIGPSALYVGPDFRFGRGRAGSKALLEALGPRFGFDVRRVEPVLQGGAPVSSTRLRECVAQGRVAEARALLSRPFAVWGTVVRGERRGRELGFPTANVDGETGLLPAAGVYATRVRLFRAEGLEEQARPSVSNIGQRPTFSGRELRLETHLLEPTGDLYGARICVEFWERLRAECAFSGPDALRAQIARDCEAAREVLDGG